MTLPFTLLHFLCQIIYRASGRTNTTLDPVRAVFYTNNQDLSTENQGFSIENEDSSF